MRRVLLLESDGRKLAAQQKRLKAAREPSRKTLEEFDFSFQPSVNERRLGELADLSFVKTKTNIVFLGPPGVGKTHLSIALSIKALEVGYSVLFTRLSHLATDLVTAPHAVALKQRMRRYLAPQVLVIDEVGYTKLTEAQATQLFALVRDRYEHGSIILTSNTSFSEWGALLGNEVLATALLDRRLPSCRGDFDPGQELPHEKSAGEREEQRASHQRGRKGGTPWKWRLTDEGVLGHLPLARSSPSWPGGGEALLCGHQEGASRGMGGRLGVRPGRLW